MTTSQELEAQVAEIELRLAEARKALEAQRAQEKNLVIEQINELIAKHGILAQELTFSTLSKENKLHPARSSQKAASKPKYRDPKTGATWTGHGKAPRWITNFDKEAREQFLIEK